jgi:hypothetical protein
MISITNYYRLKARLLLDRNLKLFTTLLSKINYILDVKATLSIDLEIKDIQRLLLKEYYNLASVFLKRKLD